jgi:hypothetical protein
MRGRRGKVVMALQADCPECAELGRDIVNDLASIGIDVAVREYTDPLAEAAKPGSRIDLLQGFLDTDYPDPVSLLRRLREFGWVGTKHLAELDRVAGLTVEAGRIEAAQALSEQLEAEARVLAFAYPVYPMYLGAHVGCGFVQPAIGAVDLLSLCREP